MAGTRPPGILVNIGGLSQPPPFFFFNIYEGLLSSRPVRPKSEICTKSPLTGFMVWSRGRQKEPCRSLACNVSFPIINLPLARQAG